MDDQEYVLTTVDNPFSPFTNFDEWLVFDRQHGYNTLEFLARICSLSPNLSEPDQEMAINEAIDEIIRENVSGMWKKVTRADYA